MTIKFKKMLTDGYLVTHRGVPIIVKKIRANNWLAQVYKRDGWCSFVLPDYSDFGNNLYTHSDSRKEAVEWVIHFIDEKAELLKSFRNYLDHLQAEIKEHEEFLASI